MPRVHLVGVGVRDMTPEELENRAKEIEISKAEEALRPMKELREKRNRLLAASDWWASSDLVMSDERKAYRQALRDLPSGLDTEEKVKGATFPTKPG